MKLPLVLLPNPDPHPLYAWTPSTKAADAERRPVLTMPTGDSGKIREYPYVLAVHGRYRPTLPMHLAQVTPDEIRDTHFRIAYRGPANSLPRVTADDVLNDDLLPGLVAGRTVLLGWSRQVDVPGLQTPTTEARQPMTELEIHGQALNTLLLNRPIETTGQRANLPLLVISAVGMALLFQRVQVREGVICLLLVLGLESVLAFTILCKLDLWLPLSLLTLSQIGCCALVAERKLAASQSGMNRLLRELSSRIRGRRWPTGFYSSDDPWSHVVACVQQTLDLSRMIILELPPKLHHLVEIKAWRCSLDEIDERRRDYRRWPYAAALQSMAPLRIDIVKRPYFQNSTPDEAQFLVALTFADQLFGFVAVGIETQTLARIDDFEPRLNDFARQMAELLYRRKSVREEQVKKNRLTSLLQRSPEQEAYLELARTTQLLERRLARLESIMEQSDTATAIYDIFGRLNLANSCMHRLVAEVGRELEDMSVADVLAELSNTSLEETRELLRNVILKRRPRSLPVRLGVRETRYLCNIRPITLESRDQSSAEKGLQLQGILCEFIDRSASSELHELKGKLAENLGNTLRNDLAAVEFAAELLASEGISPVERNEVGEMIHSKVGDAVSTLKQCERVLQQSDDTEISEAMPLDPLEELRRAIEDVQPGLDERGISVEVQRGDVSSQVQAVPAQLRQGFERILKLLATDARDHTCIRATVEERAFECVIQFANEGFGVTTAELKTALSHNSTADERARSVDNWGGHLTASAVLGTGITINLTLLRFQ